MELVELPWVWGLLGQDPRRLKLLVMKQVTLMVLVVLVLPAGHLGR
ncbi:hypothetical protein [Streptomyces sp. NBC_01451]|nr:hypothetical protein [Streptomyces sp. NBC_01451]